MRRNVPSPQLEIVVNCHYHAYYSDRVCSGDSLILFDSNEIVPESTAFTVAGQASRRFNFEWMLSRSLMLKTRREAASFDHSGLPNPAD
jgi:hypothetical protein